MGLLYLYGITRAHGRPPVDSTVVAYHRLVALVDSVPPAEFAPDALALNLASVAWVADLARRPEARLEAAMTTGAVIPARLCTLFSGAEAVRQLLADEEETLVALLERLTGAEEWGLKVFCDMAALRVAVSGRRPVDPAADAPDVAPGQAYILARRHDAALSASCTRRVEDVQDLVLDALEQFAVETRVKPLLPNAATVRPEKMLVNLAVLVAREQLAPLRAALDAVGGDVGEDGFVLEWSGPWPPYSFTGRKEIDDDDDDDDEEAGEAP